MDGTCFDPTEYGTDKAEYWTDYEREIGHLFGGHADVLELGIQDGFSLALWSDCFVSGAVCGIDLNPLPDPPGRARAYQGFQQDPEILDRVAHENAPDGFDLIIDDASHLGQYTAASFAYLWSQHLKPGGTYIIDDWSCAYWPDWPDGHKYTGDLSPLSVPPASGAARPPGLAETVRRRVRAAARPARVALTAHPRLQQAARAGYLRADRLTGTRRFPGHDWGTAGIVKRLIDLTAANSITGPRGGHPGNALPVHPITRTVVTPSQVFIHKARVPGQDSRT